MHASAFSEADVREALVAAAGNVTRAGAALGVSKVYAMRLCARHGLREFAGELRLSAGGQVTGRPPTRPTRKR